MISRMTGTAWYDTPHYYDIIYDRETEKQASFLEEVMLRHGHWNKKTPLRILEPASGSGRLVAAMAERGHQVSGFDVNENTLAYARARLAAKKLRATLWHDRLEDFTLPKNRRFDMAHCLVSTFRYVLAEDDAVSHLRSVAASLREGGLYLLGLHLTDYAHNRADHERWVEERGETHVVCNTHTWPPNRKARTEALRTRLLITQKGQTHRQETCWVFRTYSAAEMRRLLRKVPEFQYVACYDFTYDIHSPRKLDDSYADVVLVLRKSGET
jgi:SAM-dependent methyltransferase